METLEILLAALATTSLLLLFLNLHGLRRINAIGQDLRVEQKRNDQRMQKLHRSNRALQTHMRREVSELESRIEKLTRRQQDMEVRDPGQLAYSHAGKLAARGADAQELIRDCGLSEAEARLVSMMHPHRNNAA